MTLLFNAMCQFINYMEIEYLDVYYPTEEEKKDPSLYSRNVRNLIATKLNIPVTEHTVDDVKLYTEAIKNRKDFKINFIINDLQKVLNVDTKMEDLTRILTIFQSFDKNNDSYIDQNEFEEAMKNIFRANNKPSEKINQEYTQKIFKLFDIDDNGLIDFREFVLGMSMANKIKNEKGSNESQYKFAFEIFDENGDGTISKKELFNIIKTINPNSSIMELENKTDHLYSKFKKNKVGEIEYDSFSNFCDVDKEALHIASNFVSVNFNQ
jgi:lysophosphatidylcholine acyltransferase / lyso-PAF acetyltransferase